MNLKVSWKLIVLTFLVSCDFTSGLHKEILEAQSLVDKQEFLKSVDKYLDILGRNPSNQIKVKIHYQLGEIYLLYLNRASDALAQFSEVKNLSDEPLWQVKSLEKIAEINYTYLKNYKKAFLAFETLYRFTPTLDRSDYYQFQMGKCLLEENKYDQAMEVFSQISQNEKHEYYTRSFFMMGLTNYYKKNWGEASTYLRNYLGKEKYKEGIIEAKFLMANSLENNEQLKEAYEIYYSLLSEFPNPEVIKERIKSTYLRMASRKR